LLGPGSGWPHDTGSVFNISCPQPLTLFPKPLTMSSMRPSEVSDEDLTAEGTIVSVYHKDLTKEPDEEDSEMSSTTTSLEGDQKEDLMDSDDDDESGDVDSHDYSLSLSESESRGRDHSQYLSRRMRDSHWEWTERTELSAVMEVSAELLIEGAVEDDGRYIQNRQGFVGKVGMEASEIAKRPMRIRRKFWPPSHDINLDPPTKEHRDGSTGVTKGYQKDLTWPPEDRNMPPLELQKVSSMDRSRQQSECRKCQKWLPRDPRKRRHIWPRLRRTL